MQLSISQNQERPRKDQGELTPSGAINGALGEGRDGGNPFGVGAATKEMTFNDAFPPPPCPARDARKKD